MSPLSSRLGLLTLAACTLGCPQLTAQSSAANFQVEAHLEGAKPTQHRDLSDAYPPAVLWLQPLGGQILPPLPRHTFTLTQKDKMFTPHLLVVPVGSMVSFPNKDPFFHNVFSLFDGKRFDLGLYESGTTREVNFSREGVSYIFCNIHFDMSAVILAIATPLYSIANKQGSFHFEAVPQGLYAIHVWIEGQTQAELDRLVRSIQIDASTNLGAIPYKHSLPMAQHTNKFDKPYDQDKPQPY